jgi:hypothetical protein
MNDFVEHENGVELGCATFQNIQAPQGWRDGRSVLTTHTITFHHKKIISHGYMASGFVHRCGGRAISRNGWIEVCVRIVGKREWKGTRRSDELLQSVVKRTVDMLQSVVKSTVDMLQSVVKSTVDMLQSVAKSTVGMLKLWQGIVSGTGWKIYWLVIK